MSDALRSERSEDFFFFQAEDGIRDSPVTGVQTCALPISKKKTDGPYGPSKPYIKIGIYRIGETGTTSFAYNNLIIKNKKK